MITLIPEILEFYVMKTHGRLIVMVHFFRQIIKLLP